MSNFISNLKNTIFTTSTIQQKKPATASKSLREICEIAYIIILGILSLLVITGAITAMFSPPVGTSICLISLALLIILCIFNPCLVRWIFTKKPKEVPQACRSKSRPTTPSIQEGDVKPSWYRRSEEILKDTFNKGKELKSTISQHIQSRRPSEVESSDSSSKSSQQTALESPKIAAPKALTTDQKAATTKKKKQRSFSTKKTTSKIIGRTSKLTNEGKKRKKPKLQPEKQKDFGTHQSSSSDSSFSSSPPPPKRGIPSFWWSSNS
ncbi:hypothetical protein [Chlamydia serpentis]|nr:hypothetical protein [Chlamydia serpentis]